jgi:hypothetical protein
MFITPHIKTIDQLIALVEQFTGPGNGRTAYVVTAKGDEVKTAFRIVEASSLIVSNMGDGTINPAYPGELQPRDRTRLSSKMQVNNIAKSIRPVQLGDSGMSSHGAPIIGPDNVVESGNGRTMGLIRAYGSGHADGYRQYLIANAKLYGLKSDDVAKMTQPVLVRVRLDDIDRVKFAKDSNISDLQEMAASEKAFVDADSIDQNAMALFQPGESGDLLARSNQGFISRFMTDIGATAAAGLMTDDGRPTRQLVDRMQNAIFAKAYKNEKLVKLIAEEPDPELRNVLTALNVAAPDFVEMQYLSGEAHKGAVSELVEGIEASNSLDAQAMKSLIEAIGLVREAKDSGQHIQEVIAQQGMFSDNTPEGEALALFIVANNRSAKRMGRAFKLLASKINAELTHQQAAAGDMFGGEAITLPDILNAVSDELESEFGTGATLSMFEAAGNAPSLFFPAAEDIDDLINLVEAKQYSDSLGAMVGRWFERYVYGKITKDRYQRKVQEILTRGVDGLATIMSGTNYDFNNALNHELGVGEIATPFFDPIVMVNVVINGNTGDVYQLGKEWKAVADADKETKQPVADRLYKLWKHVGSYGSGNKPSKAMYEFWDWATNGVLDRFAWLDIIATSSGDAPRLRHDQMKDAHDEATKVGVDLLKFHTVHKQTFAQLKVAGKELKATLMSQRVSLHINNINAGPTKYKNIVDTVVRAVANGRMGYHSAKTPGLVQAMRELSSVGKRHVANAIDKATAQATNRVYWMTTELFEKSPAQEKATVQFINGVEIDPRLKLAWEAEHGKGMMESVLRFAYKLAGGKISTLKQIGMSAEGKRACANRSGYILLSVTDGPEVFAHEIGHHFEYSNPNMLGMAIEYLRSRQQGTRLSSMKKLTNGVNYSDDEVAIIDNLSAPYIGKVYGGKMGWQGSTEVFSMGFQYLYDHQSGAESAINGDGLIEFVAGALKGVHDAKY